MHLVVRGLVAAAIFVLLVGRGTTPTGAEPEQWDVRLVTAAGETVADLVSASEGLRSIWTSTEGRLVGYLVGAPGFANANFLSRFPDEQIPAGTPLLLVSGPRSCLAPSDVARSVVPVRGPGFTGTGFHVGGGRYVTAAHLIGGASSVQMLVEGQEVTASLVSKSDVLDVAVLSGPEGSQALTLRQAEVAPGDQLTAYGFPTGATTVPEAQSISVREITTTPAAVTLTLDYLPAGFSGGPVVDSCGAVAGLIYGNAGIEGFRISAAVSSTTLQSRLR